MMNVRILLLCAALAASPAGEARTFRWASQGDAGTMDPHAYAEVFTDSLNGLVYEYLVTRGKDYSLVPALAVSWENPEPTRWVFHLRRGVRFHDGTPFTADDVVFSFERARQSASYRGWATLAGVARKLDEHTVELKTDAPNPVVPEVVAVLFVMSKSWCEKHGVSRPQDFAAKEETFATRNAMGTGPYRLVRREAGVTTQHIRNNDWWGHREGRYESNIERIEYSPIANAATRMAALASGQLDFVLDPPVQDVARLRQDKAFRVWAGDEMRVVFFGFDQSRDELLYADVKGRNPFRDRRVRLALHHAIDADALHSQVMRGLSSPTGIALPDPAKAGVRAGLERRPAHDPVLARRLLAEAGYPQGFGFTLHCPNDRYINDERICTAVAAMWAKAGLAVKVEAMSKAQYFPKALKRDVSAFLMGWGGNSAAPIFFLRPVMRSPAANGAGAWNLGDARNPELDRLIDAIETEADPAARLRLVERAVTLVQDEALVIPLHRQVIPWVSRANVSVVHMPNNWLVPIWVRIQ